MIQPSDILVSLRDSESKLRQISKAGNPKQHERESRELFNRLRKGYGTLIVQHVDYLYGIAPAAQGQQHRSGEPAPKSQRDIAGMLWKTCFYAQIAEFRGSLKKHTSRLALLPAPAAGAAERPEEHKERLYVAQLKEAFLKFLSDSVAFYQKLMSELEEKARDRKSLTPETYRAIVNSVHRCLLYLGDLARYKEMYAERDPKDFFEALRYYERAALIEPASGNAQNQLAVLATYGDAPVVAAYHYCRSVLARSPFSGGFENLAQLLDKNSAAFHRLPAPSPNPAAGRTASAGSRHGRKGKGAVHVGDFLVRFLHVHGQLFEWSAGMHQSYAQLVTSSSAAPSAESGGSARPHWLPQLNLSARSQQSATQHSSGSTRHPAEHEGFALLLRAALDEFEELIGAGSLPDVLLVQLLAISLFSVHFAVGREASMLGWAEDLTSPAELDKYVQAHGEHPHTTAECLALLALFGLVTRTAVRVEAAMASNDRASRTVLNKALPMLQIFGTWAQLHPHYLSSARPASGRSGHPGVPRPHEAGDSVKDLADVAPPSMFQDSAGSSTPQLPGSASSQDWEDTYLASADTERVEVRARSALRAALGSLRPVLEASAAAAQKSAQPADSGASLLREHIELRGFMPLAAAVEASFDDFDPLRRSVTTMTEDRARQQRLALLVASIGAICSGQSGAEGALDSRSVPRDSRNSSERASKAQKRTGRDGVSSDGPDSVPRPPPPSSKKGPPAIAEYVAVYDQAAAAAAGLPPSAEDFPSLPARCRSEPTLTAVDAAEGSGTQVDSQSEFDQDLGETVVFKSAFVRSHQNLSGTSLSAAADRTPVPAEQGIADLPLHQSLLAPPAGLEDDFFARLSLPALADAPGPALHLSDNLPGLGGLWGLGAGGAMDGWVVDHDFNPSTTGLPPTNPQQPALNFDIFSYLDGDGAASITGHEASLLSGVFQQSPAAGSAGPGLWSGWDGRSGMAGDAPGRPHAPAGPPGLTSVSAHGSSGSLGGQPMSSGAKARTTLPPPGLG